MRIGRSPVASTIRLLASFACLGLVCNSVRVTDAKNALPIVTSLDASKPDTFSRQGIAEKSLAEGAKIGEQMAIVKAYAPRLYDRTESLQREGYPKAELWDSAMVQALDIHAWERGSAAAEQIISDKSPVELPHNPYSDNKNMYQSFANGVKARLKQYGTNAKSYAGGIFNSGKGMSQQEAEQLSEQARKSIRANLLVWKITIAEEAAQMKLEPRNVSAFLRH